MFKKFFPIIFFGLLFFFAFLPKGDVFAQLVRLDSFTPDSSVPSQQVVASGHTWCSNTKVNFYLLKESSLPKAENITATALDCDTKSSPQTATQFRFTVPNLSPATYQVRLKRSDGKMSEWINFQVEDFALKDLKLTKPIAGATEVSLNPTLEWTYRFLYCHSGTYNCSQPRFQWILKEGGQVVASDTITKTSVTVSSTLKPSTPYTWQVKLFLIVLSDGHLSLEGTSQEASFTTAASTAPTTPGPEPEPEPKPTPGQLPAPSGLSPSGSNISLPVTLKWNPVTGADKYQRQIHEAGEEYQDGAIWDTPNREAGFPGASYNTPYNWRVRACPENPGENNENCSDWNETTFTTAVAPTIPPPRTPPPAGAVCGPCPEGQICNPLRFCEFGQLLDAIIKFIFWVGMAVAPVMFIVAGLLFVTSAGDPNRVQGAKKMMLYTVLGLVTLLFAKGLIKVLQSILGWK